MPAITDMTLLANAEALRGADFLPFENTFCFTQKPAFSIGELAVDKIVEEFDGYYPSGLPTAGYSEAVFNFKLCESGLALSDDDKIDWPKRITGSIEKTLDETYTLLIPLLCEFTFHLGVIRIRDERKAVVLDALNETGHVDRLSPRDNTIFLVSAFPRNTQSLKKGDFYGNSLDNIFSDGNFDEATDAAIPPDDWVAVDKQAQLLSLVGTIHRKPKRPITATNRYRALLRAELKPKTHEPR